jgi:hypothetical protein
MHTSTMRLRYRLIVILFSEAQRSSFSLRDADKE